MRSLIPGFSIIKNRVITPLLVATEKVVDYIISDVTATTIQEEKMDDSSESQSDTGKQSLPDAFNGLSLNDSEQRRRKLKRFRCQRLEREDL